MVLIPTLKFLKEILLNFIIFTNFLYERKGFKLKKKKKKKEDKLYNYESSWQAFYKQNNFFNIIISFILCTDYNFYSNFIKIFIKFLSLDLCISKFIALNKVHAA